MEVMELIAAQLGGAEGARKLYLWADYCCIDQVRMNYKFVYVV
jgi:hypothetical protein